MLAILSGRRVANLVAIKNRDRAELVQMAALSVALLKIIDQRPDPVILAR